MLIIGSFPEGMHSELDSRKEYGETKARQWRDLFVSHKEALSSIAQPQAEEQNKGNISGTVADENGDVIPGAEVVLGGDTTYVRRTVVADQNAFFQFRDLASGGSYYVIVAATGFATWKSQVLHLDPGQFLILDHVTLKVDGGPISVTVTAFPTEIATEEVRIAERQRVLRFIPNFLVVYDRDPAPLTAKLKFELAFRVAIDPVTFVGVAGFAAINQGANTPNFPQGLKGYGQRAGVLYADGFTDLMLGGALLPSVLHQDPRYFYQGTGTTKSRLPHALFSPFWSRGDNGKWQPTIPALAVISRQRPFRKPTIRPRTRDPDWYLVILRSEPESAWSADLRRSFFCAS